MSLYSLSGVTKSFLSGGITFDALCGVSLEITAGSMVALQGPSGSGKSTLLNVLGLLEVPTAGTVNFADIVVTSQTETYLTELRRESIGFIFQNFNLVSILSAAENVEYPLLLDSTLTKAQSRARVAEALEAVGLSQFGHHRPSQLSGGQRQRVAIARALVKRPRVILADEPTANLDSKNASQITQLMQTLQKSYNTTVIVATHDQTVAARCDRIFKLIDGQIVN